MNAGDSGYWRDGDNLDRLAHLAAFPEQNPNPVVELDDRGLLYANPAALALFPDLRQREEAHGLISAARRIASGLRESGPLSGTGEADLEGTAYELEVYLVPGTGGIRVYASDITGRREAWSLLEESERRFRQLFDSTVEAIFLHDAEGRIVDCNEEACASLGYSREELLSLSVADFASDVIPKEERRRRADTPWRKALRAGPGLQSTFHKNEHRRKDGGTFPVEVGIGAMDYGRERLVLASARDISGRRRLEEELAYRTHHDPPTGLPNSELLDARLKNALARARRRQSRLTVMLLRVGGVDRARERLGYRAGDRLLDGVARRMGGCLGPEDTVARTGGDDLAVIVESAGDEETATRIILEILEALRDPLPLDEAEIQTEITAGIALAPREGPGGEPEEKPEEGPEEALDAAYESMCRARLRGEPYELSS
ncbi:sensor domain-containing diguanylate cyclase [Rubrobacter aplysinae]|uniref:sensor domain-containing diguanylate cyclase n=1 Tax=Rubrobacter aplysinae TaxID=909625 RepID=UPI00064C336D|nr:GGDEF domain-containing protein [Rubrobacter aplysinae]